MATAIAIESLWVSERCQALTPRSSASTTALPCSATGRAPRRTTSTSRSGRAQSYAERLHHRLLGAEPGASRGAGS
jgi:hypothetical protein